MHEDSGNTWLALDGEALADNSCSPSLVPISGNFVNGSCRQNMTVMNRRQKKDWVADRSFICQHFTELLTSLFTMIFISLRHA